MKETMGGTYCAVLFIFGVFASVANPNDDDNKWVIHEKKPTVENAGNLKIRLVRATSKKLYIETLCDPFCEDITWRTTAFKFYSRWTIIPRVLDLGNGQYVLQDLVSSMDYIVEARIPGSFDRIRARTCPDYLGSLNDIHLSSSGPGWLDIRWTPFSTNDCYQDIEYVTRYKVQGGNFSNYQIFGFYPIDDHGTLHVGPSHPCDDWPKLFCLLLTEGVHAGKNHTVEIRPRRIGGDDGDVGSPSTFSAYADPHNTQGAPHGGVHPDCQLWAWLGVGASLFCVAVIIGILISALVTTYEKNQRLREEALNAENEENGENEGTEGNEETEETALTTGTTESRQSRDI